MQENPLTLEEATSLGSAVAKATATVSDLCRPRPWISDGGDRSDVLGVELRVGTLLTFWTPGLGYSTLKTRLENQPSVTRVGS